MAKPEIIRLNDMLRTSFVGGRVMFAGRLAQDVEPSRAAEVLMKVQTFKDFNEDNDPHGEHDFVSVEVEGETYFAKIDYYNNTLDGGSEDPANPLVTTRVLTIFHASDY